MNTETNWGLMLCGQVLQLTGIPSLVSVSCDMEEPCVEFFQYNVMGIIFGVDRPCFWY